MRTFVYIDGFNFYYGAVRGTPYKWLNFKTLLEKLLAPHHRIIRIKYFTALVSGKFDPDQPTRQKTYIRALETQIPEIEVYYGSFTTHEVIARIACPSNSYTGPFKIPIHSGKDVTLATLACTSRQYPGPFKAPVYKTEEKGSDVNLAVHIVNDAWEDQFDCAVIVSNDSDLAEALRIVRGKGKMIGLINPRDRMPARELMRYAHFHKKVRTGVLRDSQFPDRIPGTSLTKPADWAHLP